MEKVIISKEEYQQLLKKAEELEKLKNIDFELVNKFLESKEDLKKGRFKVLA